MTLPFSQKDFEELVVLYNNGQFEKALIKAKALIICISFGLEKFSRVDCFSNNTSLIKFS